MRTSTLLLPPFPSASSRHPFLLKFMISYSFIIVTHMYMCVHTCRYDLLSPFRIAHVSVHPELTDLDEMPYVDYPMSLSLEETHASSLSSL